MERSESFYAASQQSQERNEKRINKLEGMTRRLEVTVGDLVAKAQYREKGKLPSMTERINGLTLLEGSVVEDGSEELESTAESIGESLNLVLGSRICDKCGTWLGPRLEYDGSKGRFDEYEAEILRVDLDSSEFDDCLEEPEEGWMRSNEKGKKLDGWIEPSTIIVEKDTSGCLPVEIGRAHV